MPDANQGFELTLKNARPCPFCGEDSDLSLRQVIDRVGVSCGSCWCIGPLATSEQDAVSEWNSREELPK